MFHYATDWMVINLAHDVFISYSTKDTDTANQLLTVLENNGIECWMAPRNIPGGSTYDNEIIGGITQAKVVVLLFSQYADQSEWVHKEIERAVSYKIPVISFKIENVPARNLEFLISIYQAVDAFTLPVEQHFEKLTQVVKNYLLTYHGNEVSETVKNKAFTTRYNLLLKQSVEGLSYYKQLYGKKHGKQTGKEIDLNLIPLLCQRKNNSFYQAEDIAGIGGQHFIVSGEGGSGKSTLLLHIWERLLSGAISGDATEYVPLPFLIPLNDVTSSYNDTDNEVKSTNYPLSQYLKTRYFAHSQVDTKDARETVASEISKEVNFLASCYDSVLNTRDLNITYEKPFIVLLLDGYNELRPNMKAIVDAEINNLFSLGTKFQVIMTTRNYNPNDTLSMFEDLQMSGLSEQTIAQYLQDNHVQAVETERILELIKNPMNLIHYCEGENVKEKYRQYEQIGAVRLKEIDSESAILWNYIQLSVKIRRIWEEYSNMHEQRDRLYLVFWIRFSRPWHGKWQQKECIRLNKACLSRSLPVSKNSGISVKTRLMISSLY